LIGQQSLESTFCPEIFAQVLCCTGAGSHTEVAIVEDRRRSVLPLILIVAYVDGVTRVSKAGFGYPSDKGMDIPEWGVKFFFARFV
jgi:hypothetical protein